MDESALLRQARDSDGHAVAALLDRTFGARPDQLTLFAAWLVDPNRRVLVAESSGKLIAVAVCSRLADPAIARYADITAELPSWLAGRVAGGLQVLAVAEHLRGQGLGLRLGNAMIGQLAEMGCEVAIGVSWDNGGAATSKGLYAAAGFGLLGRSAGFYAVEQRRSGQPCPYCGQPCRCVALLFARSIT